MAPATTHEADRAKLVTTLLESTAGTFRVFTAYIGVKLGLYRALAGRPATPAELARRTGTAERYVREWMEQQTVAGILLCDNPSAPAEARRFSLPSGHAEVLVDGESLDHLAPLLQLVVGATGPAPRVVEAFRTGAGIPYAEYGRDLLEGQAGMNKAMFLQLIGKEWLPAMADVDARLRADPPARVADVGCGAGWSSIGIAEAYPKAAVDGIDLDAASVDMAEANGKAAGLSGRVRFLHRDAADPRLAGRYDLVTAFECVHDMSRPVEALRAMRALLAPGGAVLVVDERVGESFTPQGQDLEWMMYGWSVLHCLPVGLADAPSAATGTVMRPGLLARYAKEAGFASTEVLPVENPFFRLYRLHP